MELHFYMHALFLPINVGAFASINNIIMNKVDEQGVTITIDSYLRTVDSRLRDQQKRKLLKISQILGRQGLHRRLVILMYSIFKRLLKKENFTSLCKRLLQLWDQLMQNQVRKGVSSGYRTALSEIIVECYTFIFPLIFDYRFHDLILDFKLYRMLWAKTISDEAFYQLRTEIDKLYKNFDLNKGLTSEHIEKIRKRFAEKGATEEEIQNYMGVTHMERRSEPSPSAQRKVRERMSSEDDDSDHLRKKVKPDQVPQHFARQNFDGYNPEQYMYAAHNNPPYPPQQQPYQMPQGGNYPPRAGMPSGSFPPTPSPNKALYPPYSRPYNPGFNAPPPPPHQAGHYPMGPSVPPSTGQNFYPESKGSHYGSYQEYKSGYPNKYAPQTVYNTPSGSYPAPPPAQPTNFLPPLPPSFPNYPNPAQRPQPKMQSDYSIDPRDLKRQSQSPEFTPKMGKSPLHIQQPPYYPQVYDTASSSRADFRNTPPPQEVTYQQPNADMGKYRTILANLKKGLSECKQCGVHFLSRENLQQHKREHFLQAQKKFQAKQSQQLGGSLAIQRQKLRQKGNFDMLCTPTQWVSAGISNEGEAAYQVSIKRLPPMERTNPVFYCYFCNQDLQVNWCAQLQEWTLNNGVKVHEMEHGLSVAHYDCYECFRNEDATFHTNTQMVN